MLLNRKPESRVAGKSGVENGVAMRTRHSLMGAYMLPALLSIASSPLAFAADAVQMPGREFKDGYVEAGGFRLHYVEAGRSDAPVLISLPGSAGLEKSRAKDLLTAKYRIIEINPPGWGDDPELTREMEQEEIGKILGEAANKLVTGSYHVLGTSMGGGNALWLAYHYPQRVKSLVLEAGMAPLRPSDLTNPLIERAQVRKRLEAGQSPIGPPPAAQPATGAAAYPTPPVDPAKPWATREYTGKQMTQRFRMMKWVQTDIGTEQLFSKVRTAGIPILALLGDKDNIIKPSVAEYYREVLPKARFVLIPGGSHDLQNSRTDAFVKEVTQFYAELP
jgi:pimeloyl-ACP methyl ester carboxylesterase